MAKKLILEDVAANAAADATCALADGGFARLVAADGSTVAECGFGIPAFDPATAGVALSNPLARDADAKGGRVDRYEAYAADGVTKLWTGTVGTEDANCILSRLDILPGAEVTISLITHRQPKQV
jgi:hypothetical protein